MANRALRRLLFSALLVLTAKGAFAQQEQWLRYRTAPDLYEAIDAGGYQSVTRTTTTPENLRLPELTNAKPLFFRWRSPAVKDGGLWLVLDSSAQKGPYDRLYVDANGDGNLADHAAIKADEVTDEQERRASSFRQVKVILNGEDGPSAYHLTIRWNNYAGTTRVGVYSAGWYEGPVSVGGKGFWCTLIDSNANGRFNDRSQNLSACDRIRLAAKDDKSFRNSETDRVTRYLGKYIEVDDKLYALEVAADGAFVKISPASDVPTGTVRVAQIIGDMSLVGEQGHFFRKPKDGLAVVPAGEYRVLRWQASRTDERGRSWQLIGRDYSDRPASVGVQAGKEINLEIGEPISSRASVEKEGSEYAISHELRGPRGEAVSIRFSDARPDAPKVRIVNADRTYDRTFSMEYG